MYLFDHNIGVLLCASILTTTKEIFMKLGSHIHASFKVN